MAGLKFSFNMEESKSSSDNDSFPPINFNVSKISSLVNSRSSMIENKILSLEAELKAANDKIKADKLFTYMVIHDLKHPTEALKEQLKQAQKKFEKLVQIIDDLTV